MGPNVVPRTDSGHLPQPAAQPAKQQRVNPKCPCPNCRAPSAAVPPPQQQMHQGQKQQQQQAAQTSGRPRPPQQGGPGAGAGDKPFQPARQVFNMNAKGVPKPLFKAQEGPKQPPAPKPAKPPKVALGIKIRKQLARLVKKKKE